MSLANNVVVGDAPVRKLYQDGTTDSPRKPRQVAVSASTSTAAQDSGANFSGTTSERVVVFFYWDPSAAAAAASDSIHLHFDKDTTIANAALTDMAFPPRTLFPLVVSGKQPYFKAFSTVAGTLSWYAGA